MLYTCAVCGKKAETIWLLASGKMLCSDCLTESENIKRRTNNDTRNV